ncbi:MAG TPA: aspartate/glutamate racemase family protein [Casimicrobiaceae bacterium]|jgi:Asp/Glu/hydantoin racemase
MSPQADHLPVRVALIHAVRDAISPIHEAFHRLWPEAVCDDLLDSSLSADRAAGEGAGEIAERFLALARYAVRTHGPRGQTAGILFTCSAFAMEIEAVQRALAIPVVKPNEGAFAEALDAGDRIGLLVTFAPALRSLQSELQRLAATRGRTISIVAGQVHGALSALQSGDAKRHDELIAAVAGDLSDVGTIVLGQFSMARAAPVVHRRTGLPIITTPDAAVRQLRDRVSVGDALERGGPRGARVARPGRPPT